MRNVKIDNEVQSLIDMLQHVVDSGGPFMMTTVDPEDSKKLRCGSRGELDFIVSASLSMIEMVTNQLRQSGLDDTGMKDILQRIANRCMSGVKAADRGRDAGENVYEEDVVVDIGNGLDFEMRNTKKRALAIESKIKTGEIRTIVCPHCDAPNLYTEAEQEEMDMSAKCKSCDTPFVAKV